jgi:tetratricopeptide (TPR) repeat protein
MEQKMDFSLPKKEEKNSGVQGLMVMLLVVAVGLSAASLYVAVKVRPVAQVRATSLSDQQVQDLVSKLASRGLYDRAAIVLKDYVSQTKLGGAEAAKASFQIGDLLANAGKYDEAVEYYYRSEMFGKVADEQQMKSKLQDCYEKMGKFAAMEREIAARTSMGGEQKKDSVVVAEIGTEKITSDRLDEIIEQQIDTQMGRYAAFMSPEQMSQRKKEMVKQYTEPAAKQKFLEGWLGQEVLYRQARETGVTEKPDVKNAIDGVVRGLAAEYVINDEVAKKVSVTDTDAKNYYEAHKGQYVEQAKDPNLPPRQKGFDEVKDQVYQQLRGEKTRDVQQAYVKSLMDKFNVVVHTSAFGGKEQEKSK